MKWRFHAVVRECNAATIDKMFNVVYCGPNYFVLENICYLFLKRYLGFQETEAERTSTKITGKGDNTVKAIQPFLGRV